ncbi:MAG: hypothetical protein A2754_00745 [Candidatus Magasanikbacteria bacterium RIFCSPHIGHO2_01_FULL_47_8]|uniref:DUF559 domain-containing protein n=1 Tax=Candidatus Magasanikbacteria bacterium RIFCSPHIGHO2_01_FULL_47_8 TaxID=1798673 RepID=A0A1F6MBE4_9BACT|nr:MAG: hypothetical protein A2754_00745 [Candidatus Magasanikbacteria bacterium RIFCSPHIGHO2_01_FULL_47_8]
MVYTYNPITKSRAKDLRNNATLSEVLLWEKLKSKQLLGYQFNRQKRIGNYIVDFYCYKLRLIIEVDGFSHNFKVDYDRKRHSDLEALGLNVVHIEDVQVKKDIDNVVQVIFDTIQTILLKN